MRTCVIGGAGFIGSEVTRQLLALGREVVVLGRRASREVHVPRGASYVAGDYGEPSVLSEVLQGVAEIIDLAYATVPQTSFADPVFDILSNLPPSVRLLQQAIAAKVRKIVFVSSGGTVYGNARYLPIGEEHPTSPISPYGITKLTIEKYAVMFHEVADLPVVIARPGNAYGEGQRSFAGQGFIATAVHSVIRGHAIRTFGAQGTVRDYVHVSDVASGILACLEHGELGHAYNIGTGVGRSNLDVLRALEPMAARASYSIRNEQLPARRFDVAVNVLDSHKLAAISGWHPKVEFVEGLEQTWRAAVDSYSS